MKKYIVIRDMPEEIYHWLVSILATAGMKAGDGADVYYSVADLAEDCNEVEVFFIPEKEDEQHGS